MRLSDRLFDRWFKSGWIVYAFILLLNGVPMYIHAQRGSWGWVVVGGIGIAINASALSVWLRARRKWAESTAQWERFLRDARN